MLRFHIASALLPLLVALSAHQLHAANVTFTETSLGKLDVRVMLESLVVSSNHQRIASAALRGAKWTAVVDGREGPLCRKIVGLGFSPDSARVAYAGWGEGTWTVFVDGKPVGTSEDIGQGTPIFTPDSQRVVWEAINQAKWTVMVDGKGGSAYDSIAKDYLVFSADGKRLGYVAAKAKNWLAVIDGKEQPEYDRVDALQFSPDGQRVAYVARRGGVWRAVVDGKEHRTYEALVRSNRNLFSPDSKHVAYAAREGTRTFIVLDGEDGKPYDGIREESLVFSADSKRVAYIAKRGDKWFTVIDGQEGPMFDQADGLRLGLADGRPVYVASTNKQWFVVRGTEEGPRFQDILTGTPVFSADGKQMAYGAVRAGKSVVLADGFESQGYTAIGAGSITPGPDGKHVAFMASDNNQWKLVVDDAASREYDFFVRGTRVVFEGPRAAHAVVVRNFEVFRVDARIAN